MTTITTTAVAPNELIESSWGNAVRTDLTGLNADKLEIAGGTLTGQVNGITPTSAAHLTRKDYVDGVVAGLLSASGGTVTGGSITIATSGQGVNLPAGEPSAAARAARKDYVDTQVALKLALTGGTITGGSITIATSGQGINLPTGEPTAAARAARKDYVDTAVNARVATSGDTMTGLLVATSAGVTVQTTPPGATYATSKSYVDGQINGRVAVAGDVMTGDLFVGSGDGYNSAAVDVSTNGQILAHVATGSVGSMALSRSGGAVGNGEGYIYFRRSGTVIGSIIIATSTSVAYVTTSDPRSKVRTGDATGVTARVQELGRRAFRGHAVDGDGQEWVYLSSHDVEDLFPELVHGERDGDEHQQVNFPGLIPALTATISDLADRVSSLERKVAAA